MSAFFTKPYFDQPFFNNTFFKGAYFQLPFFTGIGTAGSSGKVPSVSSSVISDADPTKIIVTFDKHMASTPNIKKALHVLVDGNDATIDSAHVHNFELEITLSTAVTSGQSVTWAYNDQHPTEELKSMLGVEADNQTYAVQNDVADEPADEPCPPCDPAPKKKRAKTK